MAALSDEQRKCRRPWTRHRRRARATSLAHRLRRFVTHGPPSCAQLPDKRHERLPDGLEGDSAERAAAKIIEQGGRSPGDVGFCRLLHETAARSDELQ